MQIDNEDMIGKVTISGGKGYDVVLASSPFVEALVLDKSLLTTYPNLAIPSLAIPSDVLFQQEQLRDLGDKQKESTRAVTEILAAQ
ncbi:MAG: hypothetical protein L0210_03035 [Rhodospirillales bacterium]|nr:hypothetical protein [Rhodospirillales bacterium]